VNGLNEEKVFKAKKNFRSCCSQKKLASRKVRECQATFEFKTDQINQISLFLQGSQELENFLCLAEKINSELRTSLMEEPPGRPQANGVVFLFVKYGFC